MIDVGIALLLQGLGADSMFLRNIERMPERLPGVVGYPYEWNWDHRRLVQFKQRCYPKMGTFMGTLTLQVRIGGIELALQSHRYGGLHRPALSRRRRE
jgi:hypothetical protein